MIKRIETETKIPATQECTKIVYRYLCDICGFESNDEKEVNRHHGTTHAVKDRREVNEKTFVFFENSSDMESYVNSDPFIDRSEYEWLGLGWYSLKFDSVPCPRG